SSSLRSDSEGDLSPEKTRGKQPKARLSVRELGSSTWPDFERVVEKHNGVWGGCWCTGFHLKRSEEKEWAGKHRHSKRSLFERTGLTQPSSMMGPTSLGGVSSDPLSSSRAE